MLHPDDIARLCQRKYAAFLKSVVTGDPFFPLDIRFGRPSTTGEWETLRREIAALSTANLGYRVEWSETNTRRWGRQKFPERVWFETEPDYLRALRKGDEVGRLRTNLALARDQLPQLDPWLVIHVQRVVEFADAWPDLLKLCRFFLTHPRPGIYPREVPAAPDTKFIERHQGILRSLLDFLLPGTARTEADRFEERFGLRYDEPLIRFRLLDPKLNAQLKLCVTDLAVPLSQFRALNPPSLTVFITENKMTFLTLPPLPQALAIWGGGGAAELLTAIHWLAACRLFYWGDLDVHGFHILSRLRRTFPALNSVMMNAQTLTLCAGLPIPARAAAYEDVSGLTPEEQLTYQRVTSQALLLEQERIPHPYALHQIERAAGTYL